MEIDCNCALCGNSTGCDEETLEGSIVEINGMGVVMCCDCEDEMFIKLALRKDVIVELDDEYRVKDIIKYK